MLAILAAGAATAEAQDCTATPTDPACLALSEAAAFQPRSADYLFVTTADDARATWLNPAGLAAIPDASVMGELVIDNPDAGDIRLAQWGLGFNARGFSFAFQREDFAEAEDRNTFRFAGGLNRQRLSLGFGVSLFSSGGTKQAVDLGVRYQATRSFVLGGVLRHIGRPTVNGIKFPLTGVAGVAWTPFASVVQLAGEAVLQEETDLNTGENVHYRLGARLATTGSLPLGVIGALRLASDLGFQSLTLGLAVGGRDQGLGLGTVSNAGSLRLERASLTGVARRRPNLQF